MSDPATQDVTDQAPTLGVKVATVVLTFAAGWVAQKVVGEVWRRATGNDAPLDADDPDVGVVQAVTFAAVTGGIAVLARRLAAKSAVKVAARFH